MRKGQRSTTLSRRRLLGLSGAVLALPAWSRLAQAASYPARPVRLVVGYAPGGATDITARVIAERLFDRLGQQFIVENRPGAATNIATEQVIRATPDGYTLLMASGANAINATLYDNLNFDFVRDIAPIAGIAKTPFVVIVPASFPVKTLQEFIAYLKANPGKINMASGGIGTSPHVCGELFQIMTGTKMVHVPYRGNYMSDLLAGQVHVVFNPIAQALPLIHDGKLRALGVTTAKRSAALPDVPAIGEFVKDYDAFGWYGLGAPSKTPPEIIKKLGDAMNSALADPNVTARFSQLGVEPMPLNSAGFAKHIAEEAEKWAKVIEAQSIKLN